MFSGKLKVKVIGLNKGQHGHKLSLSGLYLIHLCMDFKIILHSCCLREGEVPFVYGG